MSAVHHGTPEVERTRSDADGSKHSGGTEQVEHRKQAVSGRSTRTRREKEGRRITGKTSGAAKMSSSTYYSSVRRILSTLKPETVKQFHQLTTDESRVEFVRSIGGSGNGGRGLVEVELGVEQVEQTRRRASSVSSSKSSSNRDAHPSSTIGGKSSDDAKKYRQKGNELYEKGHLAEALEYYSRSILVAPVDEEQAQVTGTEDESEGGDKGKQTRGRDEQQRAPHPQQKQRSVRRSVSDAVSPTSNNGEYVLALGNRSACLLQLKRYEECLRDIDLALGSGYPATLRYKLLDRRARTLIEMNRFDEAADTLQSLLDGALVESRLDDERRSAVALGVEKKLNYCTSAIVSSTNQNTAPSVAANSTSGDTAAASELTTSEACLDVTGAKSDRFPGASDSFDVTYQVDRGRYAVAVKDVAVGDVILVENPFVSVLSPDQYDRRCYGCFRSNVQVPIGCHGCSIIRYCSESCRRNSWLASHQIECPYLGLLVRSGTGMLTLLTVRILLTIGLQRLLKMNRRLSTVNGEHNVTQPPEQMSLSTNASGVYVGGYAAIHGLLGHSTSRTPADLLQYTLLAIWITNILRQAGFFSEDKVFSQVGGAVLRFLQIVSCNGIEIPEMNVAETLDKSHPSTIGLGIYPTISLLNHSCDPTIELIFTDDRCAARLLQTVRAGRELTIDYGYVYYSMAADQRRQALRSQYFFDCRCSACSGNWGLKGALPTGVPSLKCVECGAVLPMPSGIDVASSGTVAAGGDLAKKGPHCQRCGVQSAPLAERLVELCVSQAKAERAIKDARRMRTDLATMAALESHLMVLDRDVILPCKDYVVCLSTLKQCYRLLGNKRTTAKSADGSTAT